jgi:ABC-type lipoprotein release transport system permease subunit
MLRYAAKLLSRLFDKRGMPIAKLAVTEVYTKKSTVGSSVLITTAVALAIVVYTVATSLSGMMDTRFFTSNMYVATNTSQRTAYFSFIKDLPDVKDVEYIYNSTDNLTINGADVKDVEILSIDENGYDCFSGIPDVPVLAGNEVSVGSVLASKYGIQAGDQVTIEFQKESYYPISKTFTVAQLCNSTRYDPTGYTIVLSENVVKDLYGDYPGILLIDTDKPAEVDSLVEKYAKGAYSSSYTKEEYDAEVRSSSAGILSIVNFSIVMGIALTFIGSVSNLLIGFEGRKRECAILLSTSLTKKQLARLFFLESLFSSAIALIVAVPMGLLMQKPVFEALSAIAANIEVTTGIGAYILFVAAMWILFVLTSRFPIRASEKMHLSEQLKYE